MEDMSRLLHTAADTLTDLAADLNDHAGTETGTEMRKRPVPASPVSRPADVPRKAR
jgi:hypothetical protein